MTGRLVIRAPNHLGELVLTLPALEEAARAGRAPPLVQVVEGLVPVLEMSGLDLEILPLRGRRRVLRAAVELRGRMREADAPAIGVLLTPSFSAALIFALARLPVRRGTATDARSWLLTDAVDRGPLLRGHRVREYRRLVAGAAGERAPGAPGPGGEGVGRDADATLPVPRLRRLGRARRAFAALREAHGAGAGEGASGTSEADDAPVIGLAPGSHAPARRWPADRFAGLAGRLAADGFRVRVFGAEGEEERTARVAAGHPAVEDLGGRTDLFALAGGLLTCRAVVSNDTGTMHLAAALGRPLVVPWGAGDPRQTRPPGERVRLLGRFGLPCHPCLERACPRRGEGYVAEDARRECLTLIEVDEVLDAVRELTARDGTRSGRSAG